MFKFIKFFLKKISIYIVTLINLIFILIIKLISPIILIRIDFQDIGRIGAYYKFDKSLSDKKYFPRRHLDIFVTYNSIKNINEQWRKMWISKTLTINRNFFSNNLINLKNKLLSNDKHNLPNHRFVNKNINEGDHRYKSLYPNNPNIFFSEKEKEKGFNILKKMGLKKNDEYICFHCRDSKFLNIVEQNKNWSYHDYRDANIDNYISAAEYITKKENLYSIRMGNIVEKSINTKNKKIIDYSNSFYQDDFMDVFLSANCKFFITSDTGMSCFPEMFRKPCIYTNWTILDGLLSYSTTTRGLIILKKYYSNKEKKILTFKEMLELKKDVATIKSIRKKEIILDEFIKNKEITLIENTPEEIKKVTIEMYKRLTNQWDESKLYIDAKLQNQFWSMFNNDRFKHPDLLIGADYLRDNEELLY